MKDNVILSKLLGNRNISIYEILHRLFSASDMEFMPRIVIHKFQVFRDILSRLSNLFSNPKSARENRDTESRRFYHRVTRLCILKPRDNNG